MNTEEYVSPRLVEDTVNDKASNPCTPQPLPKVGRRISILKSIYDDGEDHHPPSWLAVLGETLSIREVRDGCLVVAHDEAPLGTGFLVYSGEYEVVSEQLTLEFN